MNTLENSLFQKAIQSYKRRDYQTAQKYMRQVLLSDPTLVLAWLWMSTFVQDYAQKRECLERALSLDPACEAAQRGLQILQQKIAEAEKIADMDEMTISRTPARRPALKLGAYLLEQGLVTLKQLEEALEEQRLLKKKSQGIRVPLGNILVDNGVISPQVLATVLIRQQHDRLNNPGQAAPQYLGEYLVTEGYISIDQLEGALAEQLRLHKRGAASQLGEVLLRTGAIDQDMLGTALRKQQDKLFEQWQV